MPGWLSILFLPILSILGAPKPSACPPRLDVPSTQNCCKLPLINFKPYEKECGKLEIAGAQDWPCGFDCIFRTAQALNGTRLDMAKVNLMLFEVFKDQQQVIAPFKEGYEMCLTQEEDIIKTLKRRRMPLPKCSHLAMLYGICAYKHVFVHCPEQNWTNSTHCNRIRSCELKRAA